MARRLALLLLPLACAAALPPAAAFAAPAITDVSATTVSHGSATLVATVDPAGAATRVSFELGTSTSYGLSSATRTVGPAGGPVRVEIPVASLSARTTYHFRAVATPEDDAAAAVRSSDATFRTAAAPAPPSVSTSTATSIGATSMVLRARVDPRGQPTTYRFVYGTSSAYGQSTPAVAIAGGGARTVSAPITGLASGQQYSFRIEATNASGTRTGSRRTATTLAAPTSVTLRASVNPVPYGTRPVLSGDVAGPRKNNIPVVLQTTPFPFASPFATVLSPVRSTTSGAFQLTLGRLTQTTRAIVIADGRLLSPVVTLRSAVRAGILEVRRVKGGKLRVRGRITPATPRGRVSVQRRGRSGKFSRVGRGSVGAGGIYAVTVRATRTASAIRVVGLPHDGGAHVPGTSRVRTVAPR